MLKKLLHRLLEIFFKTGTPTKILNTMKNLINKKDHVIHF